MRKQNKTTVTEFYYFQIFFSFLFYFVSFSNCVCHTSNLVYRTLQSNSLSVWGFIFIMCKRIPTPHAFNRHAAHEPANDEKSKAIKASCTHATRAYHKQYQFTFVYFSQQQCSTYYTSCLCSNIVCLRRIFKRIFNIVYKIIFVQRRTTVLSAESVKVRTVFVRIEINC